MRVDKALGWTLFVLGGAAMALVLGYFGLAQYLGLHAPRGTAVQWTDVLYSDLTLFVLQPPFPPVGRLPVLLQIARFLAPAMTFLAGVETLRLLAGEQLRRWSAAMAAGHAVVTGDGIIAFELARRLRADYRKVVLIRTADSAPDQARRAGLLQVGGDPADAATLRAAGVHRAAVIYACAADSAKNAATALRAREIRAARHRPMTIYAQVRDAEIRTALAARRIGAVGDPGLRLDFFAIEQIAARALLDQYPLVTADGEPAQVVIAGFGLLGQAVLHEVALRAPAPGRRVAVTIRDRDADALRMFMGGFPVVGRNCALTRTAPDERLAGGTGPVLAFVCLPDSDEALRAGLAEAQALAGPSDRVVICSYEPSPFGGVFTGEQALLDDLSGRLSVFEVDQEACVPDRIKADLIDQIARAMHRLYLREASGRGETPAANRAAVPWERLPEGLRDSNRAQAAHIGIKLAEIGCVIVPETGSAPAFRFEDGEIERLAILEHNRWLTERQAQGFVFGPAKEGREHPDLVPWERLSGIAKEKDRTFVCELPGLLGEAGFQILRPRPGTPADRPGAART